MDYLTNSIKNIKYTEQVISQQLLEQYGLQNITLWDYQLEAAKWIVSRFEQCHGCILADEMGLGKTCTLNYEKCLVISPLSVLDNWMNEIERFTPNIKAIKLIGTAPERKSIFDQISNNDVILTTYEILLLELHQVLSIDKISMIVVDEAHRLKNPESQSHKAIDSFECCQKLLLTGTPVQNNMTELYFTLKLTAPKIFLPKYKDEFVKQFNDAKDLNEKSETLSQTISNFLLRRTKSQVLPQLPAKTETTIYHGLTILQKRIYKSILTKNAGFVVSENNDGPIGSLLNILMQLRKCILHPYMFKGVEPEPFENGEHLVTNSGKMTVFDALIKRLIETDHKTLIFSKFTTMLDIVQDYFTMRKLNYERLDGNIRSDERKAAINSFNTNEQARFFLLSTLAGGVGLNLATADTVIFLDIDFNPQNDLQALARCHRLGQTRNVKIFRLLCKGTVEEVILKRQQQKLALSSTVLQNNALSGLLNITPHSKEELRKFIGFGAERLFIETDKDDEMDVDKVIDNIDFGINGQWPDEIQAVNKENIESIEDMYEFEGQIYRKSGQKRTNQALKQLIGKEIKTKKPRLPNQENKKNEENDSDSSSDTNIDLEDECMSDINYVRGDVTYPLDTSLTTHIEVSILCVDNSGNWPSRSPRLFQSFLNKCPALKRIYSTSKPNLGDCLLVNTRNGNMIAAIVTILKGGKNEFRMVHFISCLRELSNKLNTSSIYNVHFPRIGYKSKNVNWYGIERLIKKYLCSKPNINVYIHYMSSSAQIDKKCPQSLLPVQIFKNKNFLITDGDSSDQSLVLERLLIAYGANSVQSNNMKRPLILSEDDITNVQKVTQQSIIEEIENQKQS